MAIFYNARVAALKHKLKKMLRILAKRMRILKNRKLQILNLTHQHHMSRKEKSLKEDYARFEKAFGKGKGKSRSRPGRTRQRGRDQGIKKSAREEQMWKLKTDAMKEKARDRKKEAMNRWSMTATSGGAFRGV